MSNSILEIEKTLLLDVECKRNSYYSNHQLNNWVEIYDNMQFQAPITFYQMFDSSYNIKALSGDSYDFHNKIKKVFFYYTKVIHDDNFTVD
jgi:hypothetical protein